MAGEKEQGVQGEVSLGLTQRSLEVGTARTLNSFVVGQKPLEELFSGRHVLGAGLREGVGGAGRLQPSGSTSETLPLSPPTSRCLHPHPLEQGSPASGLWTSTSCQISAAQVRNKVHSKCNMLESSQTIPHPSPWTNCLP